MPPRKTPFGLWPSPITPALIGQKARFDDVQWTDDGETLLWVEGRSDRSMVSAMRSGDARRDISGDLVVRGGVGYGGGEMTTAGQRVFFAEKGGQLYCVDLDHDRPRPVTPMFGAVASPAVSPDGRWVAYVWTDGDTDLLALGDTSGSEWPVQLARGADFYMQPAWHPSGNRLAWIEWNHPNMPWDGTLLKLANLNGTPPRVAESTVIAGDSDTPVAEPRFSPDGKYLSYIIASGEWEDLVLLNLETGQRRVLVHGEGFHLTQPAWVQGTHNYGWSADSKRIFSLRNVGGYASLWMVEVDSGANQQLDTRPYTWLHQLSVNPRRDELAFIASAPSIPDRVVRWDASGLHTAVYSDAESVSPEFFAQPRQITWDAPDGSPVYGLYSAPSNPNCFSEGLPPAIIHIHGGPTSQITVRYSAFASYFTSRGYAWLDVNYRGSTGYGRAYREALRQKWGLVDVEDAVGGAQALEAQGLADGKRLIIEGGSAGGYTVLNTLIRYPGRFKAGVCQYGVSNLFLLDMDTHKFEKHYNASMIGQLPEAAGRYREWSPVFHAGQIRDALAVFQGSVDKVVPPAQSEAIVSLLRANGVPYIYQLYEGEGHGFRKSENVADFFRQTERFLQIQVLFN